MYLQVLTCGIIYIFSFNSAFADSFQVPDYKKTIDGRNKMSSIIIALDGGTANSQILTDKIQINTQAMESYSVIVDRIITNVQAAEYFGSDRTKV
jgi:hypothetical protein